MNCEEDVCDRVDCQWVRTSQPDVYFCLRCSRERKLEEETEEPPPTEETPDIFSKILTTLLVGLLISLMAACAELPSERPIYRYYQIATGVINVTPIT